MTHPSDNYDFVLSMLLANVRIRMGGKSERSVQCMTFKEKDWFYSAPKKKRIKQTSKISRAVKNVASENYHFKLMVVNWTRFQVLDWVSCPEYFDEFWCLINKLIDGFSHFGDPGNDLRPLRVQPGEQNLLIMHKTMPFKEPWLRQLTKRVLIERT